MRNGDAANVPDWDTAFKQVLGDPLPVYESGFDILKYGQWGAFMANEFRRKHGLDIKIAMPENARARDGEPEDISINPKVNLTGDSNFQVPQSQNIKPGKTNIQKRNLYKVDFPISNSLSARVGVAPSGNIMERIKDPHIDMENDMIYLGLNYHF